MSSAPVRHVRIGRPEPPPPGRLWTALAALLLVTSLGSWLTLVLALGIRQSACYDVQSEVTATLLCERAGGDVDRAWELVWWVAAGSAALLAGAGLLDGWRQRRFAYGAHQPLRVLIVTNPAAMVGYVAGWLAGLAMTRDRSAPDRPAAGGPPVPRPRAADDHAVGRPMYPGAEPPRT